MIRRGYHGGFDPFRRIGAFASPTAVDKESDAGDVAADNQLGVANEAINTIGKGDMNSAIRAAAGRRQREGGEATAALAALQESA